DTSDKKMFPRTPSLTLCLRGPCISKPPQEGLRLLCLNEVQELLTQSPIGAVTFHRHGMHGRLHLSIRCHCDDTNPFLLPIRIRSEDHVDISLPIEDMAQDTSSFCRDIKSPLY